MIVHQNNFRRWVREAIAGTPVNRRLESASAIVLERVARAAGQTEWFFCRNQSDLKKIEQELRPGSEVSFYFDGRIRCTERPEEMAILAGLTIDARRECVIGALQENGFSVAVDFVTHVREVQEFLAEHSTAPLFFAGDFPAADNDGVAAITLIIPDKDGVTRRHPH